MPDKTTKVLQWLGAMGYAGLLSAILFPLLFRQQMIVCYLPERHCLSDLRQLATASLIYSIDHDERLMDRDAWMDALVPYHKNPELEHCPAIEKESGGSKALYGYSFDSRLSRKSLDDLENPDKQPLLFDSINLARNASDPFISLPNPPRKHIDGQPPANYVAYADTHAKALIAKGR